MLPDHTAEAKNFSGIGLDHVPLRNRPSRSALSGATPTRLTGKSEAPVHEIKNHTLSALQRQWRESISWLNGYIDLYQIHSATMESGVLDDHSVLDELARLKSEGTQDRSLVKRSGPEDNFAESDGPHAGWAHLFSSPSRQPGIYLNHLPAQRFQRRTPPASA